MSDIPGYELAESLPITTTEQKKALADPVRDVIIDLVLERAMTVTELAAVVGKAKGTVAHHVDVLVAAGLLKVVSTKRVRAMEERSYGRTARTFLFDDGPGDGLPFSGEALAIWDREHHDVEDVGGFTLRRVRIPPERATEFWGRVEALALEFTRLPRGGDREYAFYGCVFPTNRRVAPSKQRARRGS